MTILVGLGNPGGEYQRTRHNMGFMVVDQIAAKLGLEWQESKKFKALTAQRGSVWLLKPLTFMNESGQSVKALGDFYKFFSQPEWGHQTWVVHDDLDLALGNTKVQFGTGPKIHNGLLSLYQHLGTHDFWHVRVGVDGRAGDRSMPASNYVLNAFSQEEMSLVTKTVEQVTTRLLQELNHE